MVLLLCSGHRMIPLASWGEREPGQRAGNQMLRLWRTVGAELHKPPRHEGGAEASRIDWLRAGLRPHERGQRAFNRHGAKDQQASNTNGMKPVSVWNLIVERRECRIVIVGIATER